MQNILIVDVMQTDRDILGRIVTSSGHQPIYATDGAQALGAAKTARPALILLDVVMPGQDGYKTCRTLKADPQTAKIPVVLVTSKGGGSRDADDQVAKPYTREAIEAVIARYAQ